MAGVGDGLYQVSSRNLLMTFIHHGCPEGRQPGGTSGALTPDNIENTRGDLPGSTEAADKVSSQEQLTCSRPHSKCRAQSPAVLSLGASPFHSSL